MTAALEQVAFPALGTTAVVVVGEPGAMAAARAACESVIAEVDAACSRFRDDSELVRLNAHPCEHVRVSQCLIDAIDVACYGARVSDGLVDPTVGSAMRAIGYDRDFDDVDPDGPALRVVVAAVPGWRRIEVDRARRIVRVPRGVEIDLGATAKAWCADRAAARAAARTGVGVIVGLGGDISVAGDVPPGGWQVKVTDDHRAPADDPGGQTVTVAGGGLATSGTSVRRWTRAGRSLHHVIDPATGDSAAEHWRTVSVAASSCVDANIASTAAIVLGPGAPSWLSARALPARLARPDGTVVCVAGWPAEAGPAPVRRDDA